LVRQDQRRGRRTGFLDLRSFLHVANGLSKREIEERLHVISVSDFRKAVGHKWKRLAPLVETATDHIIRRHINLKKDSYTRLDGDITCIILPREDRQSSHKRISAIAKDITSHLIGSKLVAGRRPQVVAVNVALKDLLSDIGIASIHSALKEASVSASAKGGLGPAQTTTLGSAFAISGGQRPADPQDEPAWITIDRPTKEAAEMGVMQAEGRGPKLDERVMIVEKGPRGEMAVMQAEGRGPKLDERVMIVEKGPRGEMAVMQAEGRGPKSDEVVIVVNRTSAGVAVLPAFFEDNGRQDPALLSERLDALVTAGTSEARMPAEAALTLVWTPTWVTSAQGIGAYHARIIRQDRPDLEVLEGVNAYTNINPVETIALDRFAVTQAAKEVTNIFFSRSKVGVTVPIHWMSLAPRWREYIKIALEGAASQGRRRLLKVEVFGLGANITPAILNTLLSPLEGSECDVLLRLPLSIGEIAVSHPLVKGVGVDLSELDEHERCGDDALVERLAQFHERARAARLATYVWGLRRRQVISRITAIGYSLINGPGVMPDVARPGPPTGGARR
jgi:hypothetical protein